MKVAGLGTEQRDVKPAPGQECSLLSLVLCFTQLALLWAEVWAPDAAACAPLCGFADTLSLPYVTISHLRAASVSLHLSPELSVSFPIPFFLIKKKFFLAIPKGMGILVPQPGKCRVLTAGKPGKSLQLWKASQPTTVLVCFRLLCL